MSSHVESPFHHFFDRHAWFHEAGLALGGIAIGQLARIVWPALTAATVGLITVAAIPVLTYAAIGWASRSRSEPPAPWRTPRDKRRHLAEEVWHFVVRGTVAFAAAQFIAGLCGAGAIWAAHCLPAIIYLVQARPYHEMHLVMHARAQVLPGDARTFASREPPPVGAARRGVDPGVRVFERRQVATGLSIGR